jgi:GAF domain-containing protein
MRFVASRGLSDTYCRAFEGHTPWQRNAVHATPVIVADVEHDEDLGSYRDTILREGIRALVFIPLLTESQVIGNFMVYYDVRHVVSDDELRLAETIARHVAFAIERARQSAPDAG